METFIVGCPLAKSRANFLIALTSCEQLPLPVPHALLFVTLSSLPLFDTLSSLDLPCEHLELLQERFRSLYCGRKSALVRSELLELGGEELRLDILRSTIKHEQRRHIIVLNLQHPSADVKDDVSEPKTHLLFEVLENFVPLPPDFAQSVQFLRGFSHRFPQVLLLDLVQTRL